MRGKKIAAMGLVVAMLLGACGAQGDISKQEMMDIETQEVLEEDTMTTIKVSKDTASSFNNGKFEGFGTSFCWWANRIGYSDELSALAAKAFYSKDEGLGLNIIRYNIGGGDDPTHEHITRTDSMMPGYWANPSYDEETGTYAWDYDWQQDANQRNVLLHAMEEYGDGLIVEGFSNSPPYFMTNSGCSSGAVDANKDNLRTDAYEAFAKYLADVTEYYHTEVGVDFSSIDPMNEPYTNYWGAMSNKQEGCHFEPGDSQSRILCELKKALDEKGLSDVIISATDETSIDKQILAYNALSDEAKSIVGRIDTHTYQGNKRTALSELAQREGKNLWMSEVDGGDTMGKNAGQMGAALWFAEQILLDMNELKPSAWIMWQVIDNHVCADGYLGRTDSGMPDTRYGYWGTAVCDHDAKDIIFTMKYYAFGQFSRYIRPGDTILATGNHTVASYNEAENRLTIVASNITDEKQEYRFDLSEFVLDGASVEVIRTSGDMESGEKWAVLEPLTVSDSLLEVELKENSVTTFVIKGDK